MTQQKTLEKRKRFVVQSNERNLPRTMKVSENSFFPPRNSMEKPPKDYEEPSSSEGFSKFCQQTSLHGWAYLDSESGFLRRVIWVIVLVSLGLRVKSTVMIPWILLGLQMTTTVYFCSKYVDSMAVFDILLLLITNKSNLIWPYPKCQWTFLLL